MMLLLLSALLFVRRLQHVHAAPIREAKQALHGGWLINAVEYMEMNPETLDELMTKTHSVAEGDVLLSNNRNAAESVWPTCEVAFVVSEDLAHRKQDILSAMAKLSEHTCVSFHERTSETNYLLFKMSKGCASYVGFRGGEQPLLVGPPCMVGNIIHELLHALGFHHEHTRMDREQHITVLPDNIMSGMENNFKKKPGDTFGLPYDITSIMHYGRSFFSVNGLPTIVPKSDVDQMGQRQRLTESDIKRVRQLYGCDVPKKEEKKKKSGDAAKDPNSTKTAAPSSSASLQQLSAATGGRHNTS